MADGGHARLPEDLADAVDVVFNEGFDEDVVRRLDLVGGEVDDAGERGPPDGVGRRVGVGRAAEVAEGDGGEAGAEAGLARVPFLVGGEVAGPQGFDGFRGVGGDAAGSPAQADAAGFAAFFAHDAEEGGAFLVVFGPQDVDEGLPVKAVVGSGEHDGGEHAERVRRRRVDAAFVLELGDDFLGQHVQQVQERRRALRCRAGWGCV